MHLSSRSHLGPGLSPGSAQECDVNTELHLGQPRGSHSQRHIGMLCGPHMKQLAQSSLGHHLRCLNLSYQSYFLQLPTCQRWISSRIFVLSCWYSLSALPALLSYSPKETAHQNRNSQNEAWLQPTHFLKAKITSFY